MRTQICVSLKSEIDENALYDSKGEAYFICKEESLETCGPAKHSAFVFGDIARTQCLQFLAKPPPPLPYFPTKYVVS